MGTRRRRTKEMAITAFLTGHGRRASSSSSPYAARIRRAWRCGTRASSAGVGFRGTKRHAASENVHSAHAVQVGRDSDEVFGFLARRSEGNVHRAAQLRLAAFL